VGTGAGWLVHKLTLTSPEKQIRKQAERFITGIIELAASFGAPAIIGSMQGRLENETQRPEALNRLSEALDHLGEFAAREGAPLLVEPLNRYETNVLNRISDSLTFLKSLNTKNVKLLCDLFHMNIEEPSISKTVRDAGKSVGHVHWADSNRRAMGFGHTRIAPVVKALRDIGYKGYVSAEVFPLPSPEAAARQTMKSYNRYFKNS